MFRQFHEQLKQFNFSSTKINMHVSLQECAALSLHVYGGGTPLPLGWQVLFSKEYTTGYKGAIYFKQVGLDGFMVWANRGTVLNPPLSAIGNLISDLNVALGSVPILISSIQEFAIDAMPILMEKFKDIPLTNRFGLVTGHSLGAIISDILVGDPSMPSVTFENPGSKPTIMQMLKGIAIPVPDTGEIRHLTEQEIAMIMAQKQASCFTYLGGVNVINTCQEQVGSVFRFKKLPVNYNIDPKGPLAEIPSNVFANIYYLLYSLFDQHSMEKIYAHIVSGGTAEPVLNPVGLYNGYVEYLDGDEREDYWEGYFSLVWKNWPGIQDQFGGDFDKYMTYCWDKLEKTRKEAMPGREAIAEPLYPKLDTAQALSFTAPPQSVLPSLSSAPHATKFSAAPPKVTNPTPQRDQGCCLCPIL